MSIAFMEGMPFLSAQVLVGLVVLILSGNWMVRSASKLAAALGMSPTMIGLTIVAFGTSLPELMVSLFANLGPDSSGDLSIGNVVGSNITNISLIMGVGAIIAVLPIEKRMLQREYPYMLLVSLLLVLFSLGADRQISRWEGLILVIGLAFFMGYNYVAGRNTKAEDVEVVETGTQSKKRILVINLVILPVSIAGLALGADWLVDGASGLARMVGISELFIGLSVIALGTSLPELVTTIVAIRHGEEGIAVGNLVGSNIFNVLAIIGITSLIKPLAAGAATLLPLDYPVMLFTSALPFAVVWFTKFRSTKTLGIVLLLCYVGYYTKIFLDASESLF